MSKPISENGRITLEFAHGPQEYIVTDFRLESQLVGDRILCISVNTWQFFPDKGPISAHLLRVADLRKARVVPMLEKDVGANDAEEFRRLHLAYEEHFGILREKVPLRFVMPSKLVDGKWYFVRCEEEPPHRALCWFTAPAYTPDFLEAWLWPDYVAGKDPVFLRLRHEEGMDPNHPDSYRVLHVYEERPEILSPRRISDFQYLREQQLIAEYAPFARANMERRDDYNPPNTRSSMFPTGLPYRPPYSLKGE